MLNNYTPDRLPPGPASWPGINDAPFQWLPGSLSFLRRRLRPILGCGVAGVALAAAYLMVATPQYTAVGTLSIDSGRANPVDGTATAMDWQSQSAYVDSQVALLESPATLRGVVAQMHLENDPRFAGAAAHRDDPAGRALAEARAETKLLHMLQIWRVGATSVVEVRMESPDPALSAQLANAVTTAYMAQQVQAISDTTVQAGVWLQSRIGQLRAQAVAADRAVQEYKAQHNIVDVTSGGSTGLMDEQQLGELNTELAAARARVAAAQAKVEQAQEVASGGESASLTTDTVPNPVMAALQQQYLDALRLQAQLTAKLGPHHQAVLQQQQAVSDLQQSIQAEATREIAGYKADYAAATADLNSIQARLNDAISAEAQTDIQLSELRSLQTTADAYRGIYQNFLQRFTQAMQDQSYPIANARVAAAALPPIQHSAPHGKIALALGLLFGVAAGLFAAVLREALDMSVRSTAQLRGATGLECLGAIAATPALACGAHPPLPELGERQSRRIVPPAFREAERNPGSAMADAVLNLRVAAMRQSARGRPVRIIGCVAAAAGEGSSTFAANLAFALAADGQRTALVDWNAKSPWLTQMLLPGSHPGLQDLADGTAGLADVVLPLTPSGPDFIGQPRGRASGPAGPAKIHAALATLRQNYDVVVLDLPALQRSNLALQLSESIDGFVLVARWGTTPQAALAGTFAGIANMDVTFLGAVLNQCDDARMELYTPDTRKAPVYAARLPVDGLI